MDPNIRDWQSFDLLLIDVQNDFWSCSLSQQFPGFPDHISQLLQFCRVEGIEIVHIRTSFNQDRSDWMNRYRLGNQIPCIAGTPGAEVLPCARELPGEKVIVKHC